MKSRWFVAVVMTAAIAISYFDRQKLSVAIYTTMADLTFNSLAWVPYAASGVGSLAGGWLSSWMVPVCLNQPCGRCPCFSARAVDVIQFGTIRVGGVTQAREMSALAEAYSVPVTPQAGQRHNFHVVMANLKSPMDEYFPKTDVEIGNELFGYIFGGELVAKGGYNRTP